MKVNYIEEPKSDFTPFSLTLKFETKRDLDIFYSLLEKGCNPFIDEEIELFEQIHDTIILKKSK